MSEKIKDGILGLSSEVLELSRSMARITDRLDELSGHTIDLGLKQELGRVRGNLGLIRAALAGGMRVLTSLERHVHIATFSPNPKQLRIGELETEVGEEPQRSVVGDFAKNEDGSILLKILEQELAKIPATNGSVHYIPIDARVLEEMMRARRVIVGTLRVVYPWPQ